MLHMIPVGPCVEVKTTVSEICNLPTHLLYGATYLGFLFCIIKYTKKKLLKNLIPLGTGCVYSLKLFVGSRFGGVSIVFSV